MRRSHPHRRLFTDWSFFVQPSPPDAPSSTELISDIDEHGGNIVYTPYKANVIVVYGGDAGAAAPSSSPPRSSSLHHSPHLHHSSHGTSSSKHREWDYHSLVHHFADVQGSRKTFWTEPQAPHLVVTPDWVDMCIRAGKVSAWRGNPAYDRWIVWRPAGPTRDPTFPQSPRPAEDRHHARLSSQETEYFSTTSSPVLDHLDVDPPDRRPKIVHPRHQLQDIICIDSDSDDDDIVFTGCAPASSGASTSVLPVPSTRDLHFVGRHGPLRFALDLQWKEQFGGKIEAGGGKVVSLSEDPDYFVIERLSTSPLSHRRLARLRRCRDLIVVDPRFVELSHAYKRLEDAAKHEIPLESLPPAPDLEAFSPATEASTPSRRSSRSPSTTTLPGMAFDAVEVNRGEGPADGKPTGLPDLDFETSTCEESCGETEDELDAALQDTPSALVGPSEMPIEDVPDDQDDSPTDTMLTSYENSVAPGGPKLPSHASLLAMLAGGSDPASPPTKRPLQARIHLYTLEQIEAKLRKPRFPPGESKRDFGRLLNNFCSRGGESIKDLLDRLQEGEIPNAKSLYKKHRLWIAEEVKRVKLLNERREYLERIQRISARNREREGE